jgi:peptidylprolyl isomerase
MASLAKRADAGGGGAEAAVKAYPKPARQAAARQAGGKAVWRGMSWEDRLAALHLGDAGAEADPPGPAPRPAARPAGGAAAAARPSYRTCGDAPRCVLCVDIDDSRAKFARAQAFVAAKNLAYNLSSNVLAELGGSERARLPELFANDWEWSQKGPILLDLPPERIVVELDKVAAPLAVENFVALITGEKGKSGKSGKPLHYLGCPFHRVLPGFVAQAGDISTGTGAGGESIWGKKFKDDLQGLKVKLSARGQLAMCNTGKHSNTSQFFFVLGADKCKKLSGKHVVFGRIVEGLDVLDRIEAAGGGAANDGKPAVSIAIAECVLLPS